MPIIIEIILLSWLLDSFKDAIAFGNNQRWMKELWHITKALSYALPYGFLILCDSTTSNWWLLGILPVLFILHEVSYPIFKALNVWEWDRRLKIKIVRKIWRISNQGR